MDFDGLFVTLQLSSVLPAWQTNEFAAGGSLRRADRWSDRSSAIIVVGQHQQGDLYAGGVGDRPVEGDAKRRAGGDRLLPVRVFVVWVERSGAVERVGRGEH